MVKNPPANVGDIRDAGSFSGWGRSPGGGHGNPPHCSCLENPHGQRNLAGYGPWGGKQLDTTEHEARTVGQMEDMQRYMENQNRWESCVDRKGW